jgi:ribosome-associated protein
MLEEPASAGQPQPGEPGAAAGRGIPEREHPREPRGPDQLESIRLLARKAAQVASDMKGEDISLLDMHELVTYTDFLVVCSGRSARQTRRISEEIGLRLKKETGVTPAHVEGHSTGDWILLDYLDFIVHVFTPEAREFYRLDVLWKDAPAERIE